MHLRSVPPRVAPELRSHHTILALWLAFLAAPHQASAQDGYAEPAAEPVFVGQDAPAQGPAAAPQQIEIVETGPPAQQAPVTQDQGTLSPPLTRNQQPYSVVGGELGYGGVFAGDIPANPYGVSFGLFVQQRLPDNWMFGLRAGLSIGPPGPGIVGERYDYFSFNVIVDFGYELLLADLLAIRPFLGLGVEFLSGGLTDTIENLKIAPAFLMQPMVEVMLVTQGHFQIGFRGGIRIAFHNQPSGRPEVRFPVSGQVSLVVGWRL